MSFPLLVYLFFHFSFPSFGMTCKDFDVKISHEGCAGCVSMEGEVVVLLI